MDDMRINLGRSYFVKPKLAIRRVGAKNDCPLSVALAKNVSHLFELRNKSVNHAYDTIFVV